jgi:membrane protease YdiL (CAAX protease family)
MIASFPAGVYAVFFRNLSNSGLSTSTPVYSLQINVALTGVLIPIRSTLGQLFLATWLLFLVLFAVAALQRPSFFSAVRKGASSSLSTLLENPLIGTMIVLGLVLLATTVIDTLQTSAGIPTGSISGDPLSLLVSLALAPFLEETGFRFILIGVPIFLLMLVVRAPAGRTLRALLRPSAAWSDARNSQGLIAGTDFLRVFAYFLLILSAIVFGLAHYFSGAGWEVGKISEAAVGGVGLGYLYIRYGLHAAILGHWGVDYFSTVFAFLGQAVWGIPWDTSAINVFNTLPVFVTSVLVGVPAAWFFGYRFLLRISRRGEVRATEGTYPSL